MHLAFTDSPHLFLHFNEIFKESRFSYVIQHSTYFFMLTSFPELKVMENNKINTV